MRVILLLLLVMATAVVLAVRMLPWWVLLAIPVGVALGLPLFLRWGLTWLIKLPFRAKGASTAPSEPPPEPGCAGGAGARTRTTDRRGDVFLRQAPT